MTTIDHADATADLLAEQRRAMMERCGVTVEPHGESTISSVHRFYGVKQDGEWIIGYMTEIDAYQFAYDLAAECIDQGDLA